MPSTLAAFPILKRLPRETLTTLGRGERQIQRIAGFYADESTAQRALMRLRSTVGMPVASLVLLRPQDGHPAHFQRAMHALGHGRDHERALGPEHRVWGSVIGALAVGLLAWLLTLLDPRQTGGAIMSALLFGALWGAAVGALVVMLLERLPKIYRFDVTVQRELRGGSHALLVVGVPPHCQADVLALLRGSSARWCAQAPRAKRARPRHMD